MAARVLPAPATAGDEDVGPGQQGPVVDEVLDDDVGVGCVGAAQVVGRHSAGGGHDDIRLVLERLDCRGDELVRVGVVDCSLGHDHNPRRGVAHTSWQFPGRQGGSRRRQRPNELGVRGGALAGELEPRGPVEEDPRRGLHRARREVVRRDGREPVHLERRVVGRDGPLVPDDEESAQDSLTHPGAE